MKKYRLVSVSIFLFIVCIVTWHFLKIKLTTGLNIFSNDRPKPFKGVLLLLVFNFPHYDNIPILREMYEHVFERVVFCGQSGPTGMTSSAEKPHFTIDHKNGHLGYHCAVVAMEKYPGYQGYMYGNDDMVINWWNLVYRDKTKIWEGFSDVKYFKMSEISAFVDDWAWWESEEGLSACKSFYEKLRIQSKTSEEIGAAYKTALQNGNGSERCARSWSDFFYIPKRFTKRFMKISSVAFESDLFLEIAVSTITRCLDHPDNFENVNGFYFPTVDIWQISVETFWNHYHHNISFLHPFKFHLNTGMAENNMKILKNVVVNYGKKLLGKQI